ncbi:MAG: hypothetical protein LBE78_13315 [Burkholderiaceae bacterium]|nr:hypothetical protein [Burkholderiaceae bacterium]
MKIIKLILLATTFVPLEVWACRCKEPALQDAYMRADAITMVQIKEISALADGVVRVYGEALQSWKSDLPHSLNIFTGDNCIYEMKKDAIYLLYLTRSKKMIL